MRAQFDIDLSTTEEPKYEFRNQGIAIVVHKDTPNKKSIAVYNYYGCTFINETGDCSYSRRVYLEENYKIVEEPAELTLTFRNS